MGPVRIVVVVSGRARLVDVGLREDGVVRSQVQSIVSDRPCPAEDVARSHGVALTRIAERDNRMFSDALLEHCDSVGADYLVLLFNRLISGPILDRYRHRIVNFHPSLLPAFKGLHAVDDALRSGARFVGTTMHFIDEQVDEGHIILQSVQARGPETTKATVGERQFEQMCREFVQLCHWLADDRIRVRDGYVDVLGARYDNLQFSPALDAPGAIGLVVHPNDSGL